MLFFLGGGERAKVIPIPLPTPLFKIPEIVNFATFVKMFEMLRNYQYGLTINTRQLNICIDFNLVYISANFTKLHTP
jgi:hypothetical protein